MNTVLDMAKLFYNKAYENIEKKNISCAYDYLSRSLKCFSGDMETLNLIGLCAYLLCNFSEAYAYWTESTNLVPEDNRAKEYVQYIKSDDFNSLLYEYNMGLDYIKEQKYSEAIEKFKYILHYNPHFIEPYKIIGLCYSVLNDHGEAMEYWQEAYTRDIGCITVQSYMLSLHQQKNYKFNRQGVTLRKTGLYMLVIAMLVSGLFYSFYQNIQVNKEYQITKQAIVLRDGVIIDQRKLISDSYYHKNHVLEQYNNILMELDELKNEYADASQSRKDDKIEQPIDDKIVLYIDQEYLVFKNAIRYLRTGDRIQALELFENIIDNGLEKKLIAESIYFSARIYEKEGNVSEAIRRYHEYIEKYYDSNYYDDSLYHGALLLYKSGKKDDARVLLSKLAREKPDSIFNNSRVKDILN